MCNLMRKSIFAWSIEKIFGSLHIKYTAFSASYYITDGLHRYFKTLQKSIVINNIF